MFWGSTLMPLACLLVGLGFASHANGAPIPACVADDIMAADPGCPAAGPCTITKSFSVSDGCVLDFGSRAVSVSLGGELRVLTASVTVRAGAFTVAPGGLVDGNTATTGGSFTVETTGNIVVQQTDKTGRIRMSGGEQGGSLVLDAGGDIRIEGQLHAHNRNAAQASGGDIALRAGGDILIAAGSEVDAHGGLMAFGGLLDMVAGGLIEIGSPVDNTGGEGGTISMMAGRTVTIRDKLNVTGVGDAGSGGDIDIVAGTDVVIAALIHSRGTASVLGSGGGDGGAVFISANFGNITVSSEVSAQSGTPDGMGGDIELLAKGWIDVQPSGLLIANGNGIESDGGELMLDAGMDITINGLVGAEGGDSGGDISIEAGRDIAIHYLVGARSTNQGSFGGSVTIQAGLLASGNFTLSDTIDASGPGCDTLGFCSLGGDVDVSACDITVESLGVITVRVPGLEGNGGSIFLTARDQMTIQGSLDARGAGGPLDGSSTLVYPSGLPPILTGSVVPAPLSVLKATCKGSPGDPPCLDPCPVCGNSVTEFPETCDDTTGTPESCDGCSRFCQLEDCADTNRCTVDSCDSTLGCRNLFRPDGASCADTTVCNGEELCLRGRCLVGKPLTCDDANGCTLDSCDAVTGCHNDPRTGEPCSDGDACTDPDTCNALGACVSGDQIACDDANECTEDNCSPASGCVFNPLTFVPCTDDGDPCKSDVCFLGACIHPTRADGTLCNDSDACTLTDTCQDGKCTGSNRVACAPLSQCHDRGECDRATGACSNPAKQDGTTCSDASACTQTDSCQGGVCTGSDPVICAALDQCHYTGICDPTTGICSNPQKPDGTPCSDGFFCTVDSCQGGACTSTARDCRDDDVCTAGSCDESRDTCVQEPVVPCCGNGTLEAGEECDQGNQNSDEPISSCRTDCTVPRCGNGVLDDLKGERCDLGKANADEPNVSCRTDCLEQRCGDAVVDDLAGEQCDDGDRSPDDGCSPRCFLDPPPSAFLVPGKGSTKTDCIIEWKMEHVAVDRKGRPLQKQSCVDGDVGCDHDGMANGECTFQVWVCSNNTDRGLPQCRVGGEAGSKGVVVAAQVKKPSLKRALRVPVDGENRQRLLVAAAAAPVGEERDLCGPRISIRVPHKAPGKKGVTEIRLKATTSLNVKDMDVLKLSCLP